MSDQNTDITLLRWGVLSTASIARKAMLPALRAAQGCTLAAIASRDAARASEVAQQFDIPRTYSSYEALLADPDIDAIYNPLPNHLHVPMTLMALEAGKHVLCEKPLALTFAEADRLTDTARRCGKIVAEAYMTRHHPQWRRAKALVQAGRIGRLTGIQVLFSYCNTDPANVRNQADIGGGGLNDIGCYAIDAARFFFDSEPEALTATMDRDPAFGTDRLTTGAVRFSNGRHLGFTVATQSALVQQLTLLGTEGYITLDAPFNCPPDHAAHLVIDTGADLLGGGREVETIAPADQYRAQAESFTDQVLTGAPMPSSSADICRNAAALETLARAAETGRWESLHYIETLTGV